MAEYIGSRRSVASSSAAAERAFAEDDAALTCPKCGAAVRETQQWCSLCLHVLHVPEPAAPAPQPAPAPQADAADGATVAESGEWDEHRGSDLPAAETRIAVDAAAEALLAQLAVDTQRDGLQIPAFLNSKPRIAVFAVVAMSALCGASLLAMAILGAVFG